MAFRLREPVSLIMTVADGTANQKKFKPNAKNTVARKASIPASLARPSVPGSASGSGSTPGKSGTSQAPASAPQPSPSPLESTPALEEDGLPPGISSSASTAGPPTIGSSAPIQTPGTFREPSLPPSRKRAASPTPSNASKSSRTGGRPTLIHLAASTGPARRPTPSPSPAPAPPVQISNDAARPAASSSPSPAPAIATATQSTSTNMAPPAAQPTSQTRRPAPKVVSSTARASTPAPSVSRASPSPSPAYSSQPPTIGSSQMPQGGQGTPPTQSSLIDPQLLDDTQTPGAGPSRSPSQPPRALTTAEIAMQLVAGIASQPAPPPKPRSKLRKDGKPRKPYTRTNPYNKKRGTRDPSLASGTDDGEASSRASATPGPGESENGSERGTTPATTAKKTPVPKARKKPKQKTPEYDEEGNVIRKARGPYKSRGRANTEYDRRLSKFRKARSVSGAPASTSDEVDPFAEDIPIDPELLTMGSLASNFYDGDMTERAVLLKNAQKNKQEESRKERLQFERMKRIRLQPLRRRERAKRNEDRAQRRLLWEEDGAPEGEEEVSDDEIDSTDEEYEFEPDRLTPPGSPDPNQYDEEGGEEEEEGIRPDEARPEDEDDEDQEGLGLDINGAYDNGEGDGYDEEVLPETNLADWGFNVTDDQDGETGEQTVQTTGDPNEPEPDYSNLYDINPGEEGDYGDDEDGAPGFSFADYSANMENRRAQALATQNSRFVVQEDDDETRMVNSVSWQKRERTDKWTDDETDFFYSVSSFIFPWLT